MSWDIFIQALPTGISAVSEIPDDFQPEPLGSRASVLANLQQLLPEFRPDAAGFGRVGREAGSIEIDIGDDDQTQCIALFVRGSPAIVPEVSRIVAAFGGRALDMSSETGLYDQAAALASFQSYSDYRDQVLTEPSDRPRPWWRRLLRRE
jgi:hypothetical protein